jgi:hypothetical protein
MTAFYMPVSPSYRLFYDISSSFLSLLPGLSQHRDFHFMKSGKIEAVQFFGVSGFEPEVA